MLDHGGTRIRTNNDGSGSGRPKNIGSGSTTLEASPKGPGHSYDNGEAGGSDHPILASKESERQSQVLLSSHTEIDMSVHIHVQYA